MTLNVATVSTSRRRRTPRVSSSPLGGRAASLLTRDEDLAVYARIYEHSTIAHLRSYKTTGRTQ